MNIRRITTKDDAQMAAIVRANLEKRQLNIPGTAYYDEMLDHLSEYYGNDEKVKSYYVLVDDNDQVIGGIGMERLEFIEGCAELQKLYLTDAVKGEGLGAKLITHIEEVARNNGYTKMYLETHSNLATALKLYEKMGYQLIPQPDFLIHTSMDKFFLKEL